MTSNNNQLQSIIDKLNKIPSHQQLPQQLIDSCLLLVQSILSQSITSKQSTFALSSELEPIRTSLLHLIYCLTQRNLQCSVQLSIQLISNYAQLNKSVIQFIIQHNLDCNPQFIHLFKLSIDQLAQELFLQPEQPQLAHTLALIVQSHPQLLEIFYQPSLNLHHNTPFISIVRIVENDETKLSRGTRTQLIFIILKVLKDGIILRLKRATAAFDSTDLISQLAIILGSKSRRVLSDLCLNYPNLLDELNQFVNNTSQMIKPTSQHLSIKSRNQLNSFFLNSHDFMIFKIFNQLNSDSVNPKQISQVLSSRKNLFDDHQMDVSLLKKGKFKLDEEAILNDKSHLTESIREKMKSRLEAIQMNPEAEDSDESIFYNENEEESDELDTREDAGFKTVKKTVPVDIFSDDDHLFFSNKNEGLNESEDEDVLNRESEEGVDVGGLRNSLARNKNSSSTTNQPTNHANNPQQKPNDHQTHVKGWRAKETRPIQNGAEGAGPVLKNVRGGYPTRGPRGRGRGRGDIRSRCGDGSVRGKSDDKMKTNDRFNDKKTECTSTQLNPMQHQASNSSPHSNIKASNEPVECSNSHSIPLAQRGRGAPPTRSARDIAQHQKKSHDRRVRGRDRKLAQISAGI